MNGNARKPWGLPNPAFLVTALVFSCALTWAIPARAEISPTVSLRWFGGYEAEVHLGNLGLLVATAPEAETLTVFFGSTPLCTDRRNRTFFGARYFPDGPQDGWYFGAAAYTDSVSGDCGVLEPESGNLPMLGYQWLWDSGFNVDLGLRPGILALGWSF